MEKANRNNASVTPIFSGISPIFPVQKEQLDAESCGFVQIETGPRQEKSVAHFTVMDLQRGNKGVS